MFGTYRSILSLLVVLQHLGGFPVIGAYAVFGFYALSGYLMTLIMQKTYGYALRGIYKYAINRFLRIFPMYWFSCLVSIGLVLWVGKDFSVKYHPTIYIPEDLQSILYNFFIFFPYRNSPRLTPPSWALTVELFFYIGIGLGLSKNKGLSLIWFFLSIIYHAVVNILKLNYEYKYFMIPAASLPFSTGALIYFYNLDILKKFRFLNYRFAPHSLMFLLVLNWYIGYLIGSQRGVSFYFNYVINSCLIISLSNRNILPLVSKQFDKLMGDYSYPIYLIHYQAGLIIAICYGLFGISASRHTWQLLIASIPLIFIISLSFIIWIERPIEIIRDRVKVDSSK